jgi:putative inorganic carbon (hco3(-)) transporter
LRGCAALVPFDFMGFFFYIVYVVCALVRPVELFVPDLEPLRPMLVLWILAFVSALFEAFSKHEMAARPAHLWVLLWLVVAIFVSNLVRGAMGVAVASFAEFSTPAMLLVLTVLNVTNAQRLRTTCWALLCSVAWLAALAVYSYHTGWRMLTFVVSQVENENIETPNPDWMVSAATEDSGHFLWRLRAVGFMSDPNDFAQTMIMVMPLLLLAYRRGAWIRNLIFIAPPAAGLLYAISLTASRGSLFGLAALSYFALRSRLSRVKALLLLGAMGTAAFLLKSGGREISAKEDSAGQRIDAWFEGLLMLKSSPLFGVGYGQFVEHHDLTAHNSFVLGFAELGFLGYTAWIALIVMAFLGLQQVMNNVDKIGKNHPAWLPACLLQACLAGFLACAWFLSRTYQPTLYLLLGLCIAVAYCAWKPVEALSPSKPAHWALRGGAGQNLQPPLFWVRTSLLTVVLSVVAVSAFVRFSR